MYFETVDWATSKPSLSRRESAARPKADFPCTYGARDLGVLDQSRSGRLDCEISSATRRENPSGASESLSQDARSPWRCRYRGNADTTKRTTPDHPGKPQPFRSLSVQNVQLMAKDEDFGFQSFMRTKAVPHISKQKSEEGRHQFRS